MRSRPEPASDHRRLALPWGSRIAACAAAGVLVLSGCSDSGSGGGDDADEDQSNGSAGEQEPTAEEAAAEEAAARDEALAGPAEEHRQQAAELVEEMSLEEQAGQVLIGEYQGTDTAEMAQRIEELHLGGAIVMGENVPEDEDGVDTTALESSLQALSDADPDRSVAPLIGVDQEGGLVTRVGEPLIEWPAPMAYGAAADADLARQGHAAMGQQLVDLGFTAAFAPNGDVTVGAEDPTIGSRSFGSDADVVADLSLAGIRGLADSGVTGSIKHFPGHGSVTEDSHETLPVQDSSIEELTANDWVPFSEAIDAGAPMIMMGHIEVPALEEGVPSSLSSAAYQQLRDMGHDGVVVTDAMNMGALAQGYGPEDAVVRALDAGADLLLMPADVTAAHAAIVEAVESDELPADRLSEAAERVVALMLWQQELASGDLEALQGGAPDTGDVDATDLPAVGTSEVLDPDPEAVAEDIAADSVTLVSGTCQADLASTGIQIQGGGETDRARLSAAAEAAGIPVGQGLDVVLLGSAQGIAGGDVAVALDNPGALDDATAETQIALYGRSAESFAALVEVLDGGEAPGALPVAVGEAGRGESGC